MTNLHTSVSVALVIACSAAAMARQSAPQQPIFRASADYVRVDVVVTDKDDKPLTNLTKDDFGDRRGRQGADD